jgi:hypothetical protein
LRLHGAFDTAEPAGGDDLAKSYLAGLRAGCGTDSEVGMIATRIIGAPESAGANTVRSGLNRGGLPHEMFMEQTRSFAAEVLPPFARASRRGGAIGR